MAAPSPRSFLRKGTRAPASVIPGAAAAAAKKAASPSRAAAPATAEQEQEGQEGPAWYSMVVQADDSFNTRSFNPLFDEEEEQLQQDGETLLQPQQESWSDDDLNDEAEAEARVAGSAAVAAHWLRQKDPGAPLSATLPTRGSGRTVTTTGTLTAPPRPASAAAAVSAQYGWKAFAAPEHGIEGFGVGDEELEEEEEQEQQEGRDVGDDDASNLSYLAELSPDQLEEEADGGSMSASATELPAHTSWLDASARVGSLEQHVPVPTAVSSSSSCTAVRTAAASRESAEARELREFESLEARVFAEQCRAPIAPAVVQEEMEQALEQVEEAAAPGVMTTPPRRSRPPTAAASSAGAYAGSYTWDALRQLIQPAYNDDDNAKDNNAQATFVEHEAICEAASPPPLPPQCLSARSPASAVAAAAAAFSSPVHSWPGGGTQSMLYDDASEWGDNISEFGGITMSHGMSPSPPKPAAAPAAAARTLLMTQGRASEEGAAWDRSYPNTHDSTSEAGLESSGEGWADHRTPVNGERPPMANQSVASSEAPSALIQSLFFSKKGSLAKESGARGGKVAVMEAAEAAAMEQAAAVVQRKVEALDAELARYQAATAAAMEAREKAERAAAELAAERVAFDKSKVVEMEALDVAKGACGTSPSYTAPATLYHPLKRAS
jgi:hypothetical protein